MAKDGFETFEVTPGEETESVPGEKDETVEDVEEEKTGIVSESKPEPIERSEKVAKSGGCLHVTIVDHNPVIDGTDDSSYIDIRIPLGMVESGLKLIPAKKLGDIDPDMIVQMIEMGAQGELISISEEKKSISIRIE